jgi:hypothetical protein
MKTVFAWRLGASALGFLTQGLKGAKTLSGIFGAGIRQARNNLTIHTYVLIIRMK